MAKITILNPTSIPLKTADLLAPRLKDLQDKVIGFLWNTKPNGDILLNRLRTQLEQKYNLAEAIWCQKSATAVPAGADIIERLNTADAVITAVGD
ncbi:hypothetical protein ACFLXH_00585 [Chloroflexota bacterium]